jgi:glycine/D-amino acid oxidase-like deaminating enzyme
MDLHSGLPFWIVKNELYDYYQPLTEDYKIDVAIIGSGITGALVAHELCNAGVSCAVFDKRTLCTGSTAASTSQLQYEIDVPLVDIIKKHGEEMAVCAYKESLDAITALEKVFKSTKIEPDFLRVSSVFTASDRKGLRLIEREYEARQKHGLPVEFLDEEALWEKHKIKRHGALKNNEAAQMDCYRAAVSLLTHHQQKNKLPIFSHTEIVEHEEVRGGYKLRTSNGHTIRCKYLIIAAGFEAEKFLPKKVMSLNSTYAIISQPVEEEQLWPERSLIWETQSPYLYMRTTVDNRMIVGGEDVSFKSEVRRDKLLRKKIARLEKGFSELYPEIPFKTDMAWCGTFSSTSDGLPFIGPWPNKKRMLFALGYGGNGITFSMIAAQVLRNIITGKKDDRQAVFGFERMV